MVEDRGGSDVGAIPSEWSTVVVVGSPQLQRGGRSGVVRGGELLAGSSGAERRAVSVTSGMLESSSAHDGEGVGEPASWVVAVAAGSGTEGDEAPFGVLVSALAAADLLRGSVVEGRAVGEHGDAPWAGGSCRC
jgi:hypothetical protein